MHNPRSIASVVVFTVLPVSSKRQSTTELVAFERKKPTKPGSAFQLSINCSQILLRAALHSEIKNQKSEMVSAPNEIPACVLRNELRRAGELVYRA
jgi:hypothetical protein